MVVLGCGGGGGMRGSKCGGGGVVLFLIKFTNIVKNGSTIVSRLVIYWWRWTKGRFYLRIYFLVVK